jgi:hypothetical protein
VLWERSVVEQHYDAVREVLEGRGVTEVAARYGVSRQSVYTWVGRYRAGGRVPAAADPSGVGTGAAWLGAGTQGGGAAAVAGDDLADPGPQRAGRPPARRRRRRDYRPWEREAPMSLWQMDIMGGVRLVDGRGT